MCFEDHHGFDRNVPVHSLSRSPARGCRCQSVLIARSVYRTSRSRLGFGALWFAAHFTFNLQPFAIGHSKHKLDWHYADCFVSFAWIQRCYTSSPLPIQYESAKFSGNSLISHSQRASTSRARQGSSSFPRVSQPTAAYKALSLTRNFCNFCLTKRSNINEPQTCLTKHHHRLLARSPRSRHPRNT